MGRRYRARRAQKHGQAVVSKKNRSIITTVLAFGLVMFVIPMAFGLADVVNGAVASSSQLKVLNAVEFGSDHLISAAVGKCATLHYNVSNTAAGESQTVYTGADLGKNYNQVVIAYASPTEYSTRVGVLALSVNVSTQWLIAHSIIAVKLSLNTSSAKELSVVGGPYGERAAGIYPLSVNYGGGYSCVAYGHGNTVVFPIEPYGTLNATWTHNVGTCIHVNTTSTHWSEVLFDVDATNVLKADTFLDSVTNSSFVVVLAGTGNTDATSIINGDSFKFRIEFFGSAVSGVVISEYMVGGLGVLLILGSAVASPWVNPTRRG